MNSVGNQVFIDVFNSKVKEDIVTDTFNQNANNIGELDFNTDDARRRWIHNAASYAGDLDAQIEEKNKIRREVEEKEKQEELARDKWVMEDDERHKEELEKHKARKDTVKEDIVTDTLNQNTNNIGELDFNTDDARRRWIQNAASYAGDLDAQIEEKNKIRRELEEKEKQEELAREKWVMEDDERHKEELEKHKARKDTVKEDIVTNTLNQNANNIGELDFNTDDARRRWIHNAASYAGDLDAQIEEKNKIRRELEEKEKQEELAREKWVMKDDERHKEELEKHKARKDTVPDYNCATNTARSLWIHNAASYDAELHAQVEEKNKNRRELEEKEKQEELARGEWVVENDERHKEELEKSKARKYTHQKAMEEFSHCQEQNLNCEQEKIKDYEEQRKNHFKQYLTQQHQETMGDLSHHQEQIRKGNEERRISGTGQKVSESPKDALASVIDGIGHSSKEDDPVQL